MKYNKTTSRIRLFAIMCILSVWLTGGAMAGQVWICSIEHAVSSNDRGEVGEPNLGKLSRPAFLRVDAEKKEVTILSPKDRRGEVSSMDTFQKLDYGWLMTGTEHGKAWTMIINEEGNMTLSMTGDGVVWSIFGHAIREDATSLSEE